jgi:hypothetical protein
MIERHKRGVVARRKFGWRSQSSLRKSPCSAGGTESASTQFVRSVKFICLCLSESMSATAQEISQLDARPTAPVQTDSFRQSRPPLVGEDSGPTSPFPIRLAGSVQRGFGRGGKDLGCPTGQLQPDALGVLSCL